jgi:hypothetical protein
VEAARSYVHRRRARGGILQCLYRVRQKSPSLSLSLSISLYIYRVFTKSLFLSIEYFYTQGVHKVSLSISLLISIDRVFTKCLSLYLHLYIYTGCSQSVLRGRIYGMPGVIEMTLHWCHIKLIRRRYCQNF